MQSLLAVCGLELRLGQHIGPSIGAVLVQPRRDAQDAALAEARIGVDVAGAGDEGEIESWEARKAKERAKQPSQ